MSLLQAVRGSIADQALAGKRRRALVTILQLTLAAVTIAGALGHTAAMLRDCWDPSEIDYGEGIVIWQAEHILDSSLTYRNISTPPYNVTHYPPLYHLVTQAFELAIHNWLAAGRLVSVASGLGIVLTIGALVYAVLPRRVSRADRWTAAIFAGCSVFLHPFTTYWMRTARVDILGLFLSVVAMALYVCRRQQRGWLLSAVTLFVLAGFTKQALITIPLACLLLEAFLNWRRLLAPAAWGAGLTVVPVMAMQYRTHGGFLLNLVYYNGNSMALASTVPGFFSRWPHPLSRSPWCAYCVVAPMAWAGGAEHAKSRHCSGCSC
jgi:hypothetical protein